MIGNKLLCDYVRVKISQASCVIVAILASESPDAISWNPDGKSFRIGKHVEQVLPKYFRHVKITSFQR